MNFGEMQTEVNRILEENEVNPVIYTGAEIKNALNEAYEELSDTTEWYERSVNMELTADKMYYNMRVQVPEDFLAFRRAFNVQTNQWLCPTSYKELDGHTRNWQTNTGEPQYSMLRGMYWLGLWPVPDTTGSFIKVYYTAMPVALTDDTDEPVIPREYHHGLTEYAAADLLAIAGETKKALYRFSEYARWEERFKQYVNSRMSRDRIGGYSGDYLG